MLPAWTAALIATAATGAAFVINRRVWGCLPDDVPGGRKQHGRRIPLAGVVLVLVLVPWLVASAEDWLAGATLVAGIAGFLDDREKEKGGEFGWRNKALLLLFAAACAANGAADPFYDAERWAAAMLLAFVLTNATNFLDNTDGVCCALSAVSLCWLGGGQGAIAAGGFAALGFLPWNWPRAHLFLGDSGALALGVMIGGAAARGLWTPSLCVLPVLVQLIDFAQVVAARLMLGLPPWVGDRRHLTHIAHNLGVPRVLVAPLFAALLLLSWLAS